MWQMITLLYPDKPAQCSLDTLPTPPGFDDPDEDIWTYGGYLLKNQPETQLYDEDLLQTVVRCMGEF